MKKAIMTAFLFFALLGFLAPAGARAANANCNCCANSYPSYCHGISGGYCGG